MINSIRVGFIDIRGLRSGSHHVDAMEENLDTSSLDTDDDDDCIILEHVKGRDDCSIFFSLQPPAFLLLQKGNAFL